LPDQDGFDTFFDALAGAGDIPIVVLTGSSLRPFAEDSVRAHAAEFIAKSDLDQEKLVKALLRACSQKRRSAADL
jgi:DNA-binding NarL/FixJ family response regulator